MTDILADGNAPGSLSEGELLRHIADRIEVLNDLVIEKLEEAGKRADHADEVAHEVQRQVAAITTLLEQHKPLLDRLADPGAAVRAFFTPRGRHAVREDGQGSLPLAVRPPPHRAAGPRLLRNRRLQAQAAQEEEAMTPQIGLHPDSLILGYADELIAEHKRAAGDRLDLESLEGRLANTLETIVRIVREGR